jgi:hypothetical protein
MYLDSYSAGERLRRLKQRARASAKREARHDRRRYKRAAAPNGVAVGSGDDVALSLDRRRAPRCAVASTELLLRRIGGFNFEVSLSDVSTGGCRVELVEACEPGEDVITRFPDLEALGAWVRWTSGMMAGVEFIRPIHPAVFDALLTRLASDLPPRA